MKRISAGQQCLWISTTEEAYFEVQPPALSPATAEGSRHRPPLGPISHYDQHQSRGFTSLQDGDMQCALGLTLMLMEWTPPNAACTRDTAVAQKVCARSGCLMRWRMTLVGSVRRLCHHAEEEYRSAGHQIKRFERGKGRGGGGTRVRWLRGSHIKVRA